MHRGWLFCVLFTLALLVGAAASSSAALVLRKSNGQSVLGAIVSQNESGVIIREAQSDGSTRDITIPRADIDELIVTVSPERLSELDPASPQQYLEYAEELAEKRVDPEARTAAIRLYQIAAVLDAERLGPGALLGMISLARSSAEETRFRATAYLLDPRHDASLLSRAALATSRQAPPRPEAVRDLLLALQAARRGRGTQAQELASRADVRELLQAHADYLSPSEFAALCRNETLSSEPLQKLLSLELLLEDEVAGKGTAANRAQAPAMKPWSESLTRGELGRAPNLQLDKLTEFDPHACLYRAGKWVRQN